MKKFYRCFRVLLMTFTFGLASVWFFHNIKFASNEEEIKNATIVTIAPAQPRFIKSDRACGFGYSQSYIEPVCN